MAGLKWICKGEDDCVHTRGIFCSSRFNIHLLETQTPQ